MGASKINLKDHVYWLPLHLVQYRGADKSLARPTSLFILFDGENISFDASIHTHTRARARAKDVRKAKNVLPYKDIY
jgi:hypothetical protein